MSRQGSRMGQFNRNGGNNEQSEVNRGEANRETLRQFSALIRGGVGRHRFPERFSSPIVGPDPPTNLAHIHPENYLALSAGFRANNSTGAMMRLIFASPPGDAGNRSNINNASGAENQSAPNTAITTGGGGGGQGGGEGGSMSGVLRRTPFKRSTPDYGRREFVTGESSSAGANNAQAVAAAAAAVAVAVAAANEENNNVNISAAMCTCITCPLHGTPGHHHHPASGNRSAALGGGGNVWLSAEVQRALQNDRAEREMVLHAPGANARRLVPITNMYSSSPPFGVGDYCPIHHNHNHNPNHNNHHRHNNHYTPYWTNMMRPRRNTTPSPPSSPGRITVTIRPPPPPVPQGAATTRNRNVSGVNQLLAAFPPPELSSAAGAWVQRLNVHEEYLSRSYPGSDDPVNNFVIRSHLVDPNQAVGVLARNPPPVPLPPYIANVNRVRQEIRNAIEHLLNGGSIRMEELLILDYSIVLNLLESVVEEEQIQHIPIPNEAVLFNMEENIGEAAEIGLTEREIVTFLPREIFRSNDEGNQNDDLCSICQEDCVDGEELGRLDCRHKYHYRCIKHWLAIKNLCPICKQMALAAPNEDDEEDEDEDEDGDT